jgi:hypothetical protein
MNRFVAGDRAPSSPEGAKMLACTHPAFDGPVILRRVRRSVYCTASFSVCSRRRTELPTSTQIFASTTNLQHCPLKSVRVSRKNFVRIVLAVSMLTILLPRRSVPFPGLAVAAFGAPRSCLPPHPRHRGSRRWERVVESPWRLQSLGRASISMIFFCCVSFSALKTSLAK